MISIQCHKKFEENLINTKKVMSISLANGNTLLFCVKLTEKRALLVLLLHGSGERERESKGRQDKTAIHIQCVSVDSTSFVIYPELEATEGRFSALKRYLCSFYFRIDNETGRIQ